MPGADLGDHGLDARALLVALAVDLLGARQQRLDLAEVDEHVVAVAGLLDDAGDDLADAVDVLLVHHLALGLADPLEDHLLRRLRGDAAEVLGGDVGALDERRVDVGPVDLQVLVGDEDVRVLAGLDLLLLELGDRALAGLLDQAHLDVGRQLDREDLEVPALGVELDGRVPGGVRGLLVRGEQGVLERVDQGVLFDPLLALDRLDRLDDLSAHLSPSSTRLPRTIASYGMVMRAPSATSSARSCVSAAATVPRNFFRPSARRSVRIETL